MSPEKYKKLLEAARSISKESIEEHINSLIKSREILEERCDILNLELKYTTSLKDYLKDISEDDLWNLYNTAEKFGTPMSQNIYFKELSEALDSENEIFLYKDYLFTAFYGQGEAIVQHTPRSKCDLVLGQEQLSFNF